MLRDLTQNDIIYKAPEQLTIPCLDKGYVKYVNHMGGDATIVQAARQSTTGELKSYEQDVKLLDHLFRNRHTSPFEMCQVIVEMKLPMFVARQMIRHRTASVNEFSARYSELPDEWYVPELELVHEQSDYVLFPAQDKKNHQARNGRVEVDLGSWDEGPEMAFANYKDLLREGGARELSRIHLPLSTYTKWWWSMNLHNYMHMVRLRDDVHAQYEIQVYGKAIKKILEFVAPESMRIFNKYELKMVERNDSD